MPDEQAQKSSKGFQLERRTFILLGAGAVAGLATSNLAASVLSLGTLSSALPDSLSVAYVDGRVISPQDPTHIIDARLLPTGDPRFLSSPAIVRVFGFWRSDANRDKPISLTLVPYYPTSLSIGGDSPFYAWNYVKAGGGTSRPSPAMFRIPVDDDGIRLQLEAAIPPSQTTEVLRRRAISSTAPVPVSPSDLDSKKNVARLTLGSDQGAMKLKPGTYLVALVPADSAPPDWENINYTPSKRTSDAGPLAAEGILGPSKVPFDYLGLSIDLVTPVPSPF